MTRMSLADCGALASGGLFVAAAAVGAGLAGALFAAAVVVFALAWMAAR